MKIFLSAITEQQTDLDFTEREDWVTHVISKIDETSESEAALNALRPKSATASARPAQVSFSLRRVDEVILVTGDIKTEIHLLCSRCATTYSRHCTPHFSALFCKDPVMAGIAHRGTNHAGQETGKIIGHTHGKARHAHDFSADREAKGESQDLDITYLSEDFIDLSALLTEQLQLQVPFQPLCSDECKGMCHQCGADLNTGRCACVKTSDTAFSGLKSFKPKSENLTGKQS